MIHTAALVASILFQSHAMPDASADDLAFLAGHWRGESHGSVIEEFWLPPTAGNLSGVFRMSDSEHVSVVEMMTLTEEAGGLVYRLRHFDTALVPWKSEADGPMQSSSVVLVDEDSVRFEFDEASGVEAITYDREDDAMTARVLFPEASGREAFVLVFERVE